MSMTEKELKDRLAKIREIRARREKVLDDYNHAVHLLVAKLEIDVKVTVETRSQ